MFILFFLLGLFSEFFFLLKKVFVYDFIFLNVELILDVICNGEVLFDYLL